MKKIYKYTALAVFALGFTACSQDDDFTPQQEDIVKIASANIHTTDGKTFFNGYFYNLYFWCFVCT